MKLIRIAQVTIVAAIIVAAQSMKDDPGARLRAAIEKESVDGDLKAAIKQYGDIVARYRKTDRAVAATALVRMAEAHQKLGSAEARKLFEQVVKEYADQKEAVALAKAALGGGGQAGQQVARLVLTKEGNFSWNVAISSDSRYLSFPDWETGDLVLHDISTGSARRLTDRATWEHPNMAMAGSPSFSRDGKQVAYSWFDGKRNRYELRIASLQTSGVPPSRTLVDNEDYYDPWQRDWSPDNKWLVVTLDRKDGSGQLGLISTQDGSLRVLKSRRENESLVAGGFSPDGNYIIYTHRTPGRGSQGYVLSVDGKSEVPLVSGPSSVASPVWTPDGSGVVFVSNRGGSPGLWSVRVADGKPMGEPELLKADFRNADPVGFARDGSLFYTVRSEQSNIYLAGLDSATGMLLSEPRRVNQRSIGASRGRVAWLPDGKSLSFWSRQNERDALVVHTLATGEERVVSVQDGGGRPDYGGWFPDGKTFLSWQTKGETQVFRRVDARTGEAQATWTVADAPLVSIVFSPSLMTLFFARKDGAVPCEGDKCTYIMVARDLQTGRDREIFRTKYLPITPAVSPDGRNLTFAVRHDSEGRSLMIAPVAGGTPRELHRGMFFTPLAWTGDASHILGLNAFYGRGAVYSFPVTGGPPEKSSFPANMRGMSPRVSPDGTQIAFEGIVRDWQVWTLSGLLPDAKPAAAR